MSTVEVLTKSGAMIRAENDTIEQKAMLSVATRAFGGAVTIVGPDQGVDYDDGYPYVNEGGKH